jgi:hypothetical protein
MHIPDPIRDGNVWRFPNGKTLPVVRGGDPTATPPADPPTPEPTPSAPADPPADPPAPDPGDEPLGEPGKKALEAERARASALDKQLKAQAAELEELKKATMSDQEKALAEARSEGEKAADEKWRTQVGQAHVRAAAATSFASPDDAHLFIDEVPFTDDGQVDTVALEAKLAAVLESKPYLAAGGGATPPTPPPGVPTGPRGGSGPQLTKDDLKRMSSDEIAEAYRKGELSHLTTSTT